MSAVSGEDGAVDCWEGDGFVLIAAAFCDDVEVGWWVEVEFGWHEGVAVTVVVKVDVAAAGAGGAVLVVADGDDGGWTGSW